MSLVQHGARIALVMIGVAGLAGWLNYHSEVTFADGLRCLKQAEAIDRGAWTDGMIGSVEHPMHPLAIAAVHRLIGGEGPVSWQHAAQGASILGVVLLVIPVYLLGLEIYGPATAWLGCLLVIVNPIMAHVVTNVLSETTFLLFWTWGLWAAARFLREGRFFWLPLTIGFGALAYLSRPEGILLATALVATLVVLPMHRATRIYWPRWWAAVAFLVIGSVCLVSPYIAAKGGIGTRPAIARLIGTAPPADALAVERDRPLPPEQSTLETYGLAVQRMIKAFGGAITLPLLPLAALGLMVARPWTSRARIWLFAWFIIGISALALVRLHVTGGYCTIRHALVPAMLLRLAAAHGLAWLICTVAIEGHWLGLNEGRFRPGPAVWVLLLAALIGLPFAPSVVRVKGSFDAYRDTGSWLAEVLGKGPGKVLDMTDWSLYFSDERSRQEPGFRLNDLAAASADPKTRWIVARRAHLHGHWRYSRLLQGIVGSREPVMKFPADPRPGQVQICVYDRWANPATPPASQVAGQPQPARQDEVRRR